MVLRLCGSLCAASFLCLLSPELARAQPMEGGVRTEQRRPIEEHRFAARPLLFELRVGFGTIVGELGVTASYSPWSFLGIGAGAGVGLGGGQLGAMIDLRPITFLSKRWARLHAIGVELGYSTGPFKYYQQDVMGGGGSIVYSWDRVHWAEPLLFYETQSYRGVNIFAGIGVAIPFAKSGYHCLDTELCGNSGPQLGAITTVTAGFGYAWDGSS